LFSRTKGYWFYFMVIPYNYVIMMNLFNSLFELLGKGPSFKCHSLLIMIVDFVRWQQINGLWVVSSCISNKYKIGFQ
jgi:hypothetical protein